jgi:hypothetical protein
MWGLGQHTLLGIVVGSCGVSGNILLKWVLLLVHVGLRATHFTGYCFLVYVGLGQHTLLGIVVGLCGASGNTLLSVVVGLRGAFGNTLYWICGTSAMGLK